MVENLNHKLNLYMLDVFFIFRKESKQFNKDMKTMMAVSGIRGTVSKLLDNNGIAANEVISETEKDILQEIHDQNKNLIVYRISLKYPQRDPEDLKWAIKHKCCEINKLTGFPLVSSFLTAKKLSDKEVEEFHQNKGSLWIDADIFNALGASIET